MSVAIAAFNEFGGVTMVADRKASCAGIVCGERSKLVRNAAGVALAFTGTVGDRALVEREMLEVLTNASRENVIAALDVARNRLSERGCGKNEDGGWRLGCLISDGRFLWETDNDLLAVPIDRGQGIAVQGCGWYVAVAAYHAAQRLGAGPDRAVRVACEVTAELHIECGPPIDVLCLEPRP